MRLRGLILEIKKVTVKGRRPAERDEGRPACGMHLFTGVDWPPADRGHNDTVDGIPARRNRPWVRREIEWGCSSDQKEPTPRSVCHSWRRADHDRRGSFVLCDDAREGGAGFATRCETLCLRPSSARRRRRHRDNRSKGRTLARRTVRREKPETPCPARRRDLTRGDHDKLSNRLPVGDRGGEWSRSSVRPY